LVQDQVYRVVQVQVTGIARQELNPVGRRVVFADRAGQADDRRVVDRVHAGALLGGKQRQQPGTGAEIDDHVSGADQSGDPLSVGLHPGDVSEHFLVLVQVGEFSDVVHISKQIADGLVVFENPKSSPQG